jgi:hypothetical protein
MPIETPLLDFLAKMTWNFEAFRVFLIFRLRF